MDDANQTLRSLLLAAEKDAEKWQEIAMRSNRLAEGAETEHRERAETMEAERLQLVERVRRVSANLIKAFRKHKREIKKLQAEIERSKKVPNWNALSVEEILEASRTMPQVAGAWKLGADGATWIRVGVGARIVASVKPTTEDPSMPRWLGHVAMGGFHEWDTLELAQEMCDRLLRVGGFRLG